MDHFATTGERRDANPPGRESRPRRFHHLVPSLLLLLLAALGCELLEPRDSNRPDDDGEITWRPPLSPDAVLANLREVVVTLEPNLYGELLADSGWTRPFQFSGDQSVGGPGTSWGRAEELEAWLRFTDHYRTERTLPTLTLLPSDSLLTGDSASYTATYHLMFPLAPDLDITSYAGRMRLSMSRNSTTGHWAIHLWEDWGTDSLASWTQLKQGFLWP